MRVEDDHQNKKGARRTAGFDTQVLIQRNTHIIWIIMGKMSVATCT